MFTMLWLYPQLLQLIGKVEAGRMRYKSYMGITKHHDESIEVATVNKVPLLPQIIVYSHS